jgi:hypothetical protein
MVRHPHNFSPNTNFRKYQDHRKAMKVATSRKRPTSANQVSPSALSKISSQHGGQRRGAGRKPGSRNKPTFEHEPCAAALANALDGQPAFLFIEAMRVLEAPMDDTRAALGLSHDQFIKEYGVFIAACADLRCRGEIAFFAAPPKA